MVRSLQAVYRFLVGLGYFMPLQLLVSQVRDHKIILLFWGFLFGVLGGVVLKPFGANFLLLEPVYFDELSATAMFIQGLAVGIFSLAYQMTMYILDGYKFFFLALQKRPFIKFALNNSLLPTAFWIAYIVAFIRLENFENGMPPSRIATLLGAFVGGGALISVLSALYFGTTNKDIFKIIGKRVVRELKNQRLILRRARNALGITQRVDYYLTETFGLRKVPAEVQGDFRSIVRVMNQNHANAVVAQLFMFLLLFVLWVFQGTPDLQVPAAATFLVLMAFFLMSVGAVSYWLRRIGFVTIVLLGLLLYFLNTFQPFIGQYYAYGLDYAPPPVHYNLDHFRELTTPEIVAADSQATIASLNRWRQRYVQQYGYWPRPKLVVLMSTGGGLRAAYWTVLCLQHTDSLLDGRLMDQTRLMTGASGGMLGAAFYRELYWAALRTDTVNPNARRHLEAIGKDQLSAVFFNAGVNLFFPNRKFEDLDQAYYRDRGWAWEKQFVQNTGAFQGRRLGHYRQAEAAARIPQLILTPAFVNDGRQLYISSLGVSYLSRAKRFNAAYANNIGGVEFRRLFARHRPDSLLFTTGLRMNASFPYILPFVELPTEPATEVMDAGIVDNYGIYTALRFVHFFRDWINANTGGVVLLQIRDSKRAFDIPPSASRSILARLLGGFGGAVNANAYKADLLNDHALEYLSTALRVPLDVIDLQYIPEKKFETISLNLHLAAQEKAKIQKAIARPENQRALRELKRLLFPREPLLPLPDSLEVPGVLPVPALN